MEGPSGGSRSMVKWSIALRGSAFVAMDGHLKVDEEVAVVEYASRWW